MVRLHPHKEFAEVLAGQPKEKKLSNLSKTELYGLVIKLGLRVCQLIQLFTLLITFFNLVCNYLG